MTLTSTEESDLAGGMTTEDQGLMLGVLAALRSSSLSADEQQRRLNAMIVELQHLRRNLETSPASRVSAASASLLAPTHGYRHPPPV